MRILELLQAINDAPGDAPASISLAQWRALNTLDLVHGQYITDLGREVLVMMGGHL